MSIDGIAVSDFQGLHDLKLKAQDNPDKALPEVAKQFEAVFLQSMLKSMRMGEHFIDETSPFRPGKAEETFQEMLDGQYASNIATGRGIGFADMLVRQLEKTQDKSNSAALTREIDQASLKAGLAKIKPASEKTQSSSFGGIDDFVRSVWPYARQAASVLGLDPKILMAQAALETGWGQYVAKDAEGRSSNNFFNIKAKSSDDESVNVKTTEFVSSTPIQINAAFRKYPSVAHSFNDYVSLIKGSGRYEVALANSDNPERYMDELHRAGYATDPHYASKILSIYHGDELQNALNRNGLG